MIDLTLLICVKTDEIMADKFLYIFRLNFVIHDNLLSSNNFITTGGPVLTNEIEYFNKKN